MDFKICKNIAECEALWQSFSPNERLFDVWAYRVCFFDKREHEPHFIVGYNNDGVEGFVPLVFIKRKNQYNYFGGWFTAERNSFYIKDKTKLPDFLEQCPENTYIEGLDPKQGNYYKFLDDEYTHYLDLSRYDYSFETYFSSLGKKRQKNLRYEINNIPEYEIYSNRIKDFKRLIELNIKRFEDDSKFNDKTITNGIYNLIKLLGEKGILDMISVGINNKVEAVDIGAVFNGRYYALIGSSNYQRIPNLGKLMTILDIKSAIAKKARFIEFGATSDHWKNMWEFDKDMLLKFMKWQLKP